MPFTPWGERAVADCALKSFALIAFPAVQLFFLGWMNGAAAFAGRAGRTAASAANQRRDSRRDALCLG